MFSKSLQPKSREYYHFSVLSTILIARSSHKTVQPSRLLDGEMANPRNDIVAIPRVTAQPPSVDFIQNNLPYYHGGFSNRFCRYDPQLQCFVPYAEALEYLPSSENYNGPSGSEVLPPRQHGPAVLAMRFWSQILPDAMKRFTTDQKESELIKNSHLSIRTKTTWEEFYSQLQSAQETYNGPKSGLRGKLRTGYRRIYRTLADNSEVPGKVATGLLDQDVVSPVKALVEVVFDVSFSISILFRVHIKFSLEAGPIRALTSPKRPFG